MKKELQFLGADVSQNPWIPDNVYSRLEKEEVFYLDVWRTTLFLHVGDGEGEVFSLTDYLEIKDFIKRYNVVFILPKKVLTELILLGTISTNFEITKLFKIE